MPSSHAGDAAAFAAAAGAQSRRLGVPFGLFAALISVSRITTARHYPSDVTVGVLTGIAVGLLVGRTPAVGTAVLASRHDDQRSPAS